MKANDRLKQIRLELRLNQKEFAKMLNLRQGSYSDVETGKSPISESVRSKLKDLGYDLNYSVSEQTKKRLLESIRELGYENDKATLITLMSIPSSELNFVTLSGSPSELFMNVFFRTFPQVNRKYVLEGSGTLFSAEYVEIIHLRKEVKMLQQNIEAKDKLINALESQISFLQKP